MDISGIKPGKMPQHVVLIGDRRVEGAGGSYVFVIQKLLNHMKRHILAQHHDRPVMPDVVRGQSLIQSGGRHRILDGQVQGRVTEPLAA